MTLFCDQDLENLHTVSSNLKKYPSNTEKRSWDAGTKAIAGAD
jgi:hypothetical protein